MSKKHIMMPHKATASSLYDSPQLWQYIIPLFLIPCAIFIAYGTSLWYDFQFDDVASINKFFSNRTNNFWNLAFQHPRWLSYWINSIHQSLYHFKPLGYRVFTVSLHSLSSILIFFFLFKALPRLKNQAFFVRNAFWIALTTALLFALHPVQTQTVTYVIQGELEGLACFFAVACSLVFLLSQQAPRNSLRKKILLGLLFVLGIIGCGSKEIFIVTPALLLLIDWFFIAQGDWQSLKSRLKIHIPFACTILSMYILYFGIRHLTRLLTLQHEAINNIGNVLTENPGEKIKPWAFFRSQFKVILHYITMFIWPFNICVEYDWKISRSFFSLDCILPLMALCTLGGLLWHIAQKYNARVLLFGALWFLIVLAPRSSFIPSSELLTDYKTFMGSMGIFLLGACFIIYCMEKAKKYVEVLRTEYAPIAILPTLIFLMLPVGYLAHARNCIWSSGEAFWGNILKNAPGKPRAYNNYGVALSEGGKYQESIPYYLKAIQMDNHYPDPVNNIAVAYAQTGNLDRGIFYLEKLIEMQPNYPEGYNNLASFLIQKEEFGRAEATLKTALKLRPHYGKAYYNLGKIHFAQNKMDEAYEAFKAACTIADLDNPAGFETFGRICVALKKYDEAALAFKKMARLAPSKESYFQLGNVYHINNDFTNALQAYHQAERYNSQDNRLMYNIGETYAKLRDPQKALAYFQKAQALHYNGANLPIRVAWCLKTLDRLDEAKALLEQITRQPQMPDEIKQVAHNELKMMASTKV